MKKYEAMAIDFAEQIEPIYSVQSGRYEGLYAGFIEGFETARKMAAQLVDEKRIAKGIARITSEDVLKLGIEYIAPNIRGLYETRATSRIKAKVTE